MFVIKDVAETSIDYPIETIADIEKIIYFDIETTGLLRDKCCIYLIGAMYYDQGVLKYAQWFAENYNDEANVLMAFHSFLEKFDTIIHFNGNSFDIPFVKARGIKYNIDFNFDRFKSIDIYKSIRPYKNLLNLENQQQKTYEKILGINRVDQFSGKDLIEVYKTYVETKNDKLILSLLLHNKEDVLYMGRITSLLAISDIFEGKYEISSYKFNKYTNMNGMNSEELLVTLNLYTELPTKINYSKIDYAFKAERKTANIRINCLNDTLKLFFENYSDYYYLPEEDKAIHKSVSKFVDKEYRTKATAKTCYENHCDIFLPHFCGLNSKYTFKTKYESNDYFIRKNDINKECIKDYVDAFLDHIKKEA